MHITKNLSNTKRGEHFNAALVVILLSITIVLIAFLSEGNNFTGYVVSSDETDSTYTIQPSLREYDNVDSLKSLASGNYSVPVQK